MYFTQFDVEKRLGICWIQNLANAFTISDAKPARVTARNKLRFCEGNEKVEAHSMHMTTAGSTLNEHLMEGMAQIELDFPLFVAIPSVLS